MRGIFRACVFLCAVGLLACSDANGVYFQHRVNETTAERVAKRYGSPHKLEQPPEGGMIWTYFERGSGTVSYAGVARSSYCHKYILTFDREEVLRNWQHEECQD
jgi:hypothetical protein